MAIHILGIRHHGPGSARNVRNFLESVKPDIVLIEGPPEADGLLKWAGDGQLKPPVAILCYQPDNPQRSAFYPFAEFSPEWQAIVYAQTQRIHVRFMDLPAANQFIIEHGEKAAEPPVQADEPTVPSDEEPSDHDDEPAVAHTDEESPVHTTLQGNGMSWLAQAAGFPDEHKWWEHMFENRAGAEPVFDAVQEAMTAVREHFPTPSHDKLEQYREAHMRQTIRNAEKEMFQEIAVICGAWHVPALTSMPPRKEDAELLKGLPKVKVETTWVPWTYQRLTFASGYGAGVPSPGWYHHLWTYPEDDGSRWLSKIAALLRGQGIDVSVAHVMEAVRLAESLSALRGLSRIGLQELNEATISVLCNGESIRMSLISKELIVSDRIGEVPAEIPKPPLQVDIEKLQKRLRLPPTADWKDYTLDLRKENDLERSIFLHRLRLLNINWGSLSEASGKGTFKEQWRLQWNPDFSIDILDKGSYGNTVEEAASAYVSKTAIDASSLKEVARLLAESLPAELPKATEQLIRQVENMSAASNDVLQLMEVIPGLVTVSRYGNVRGTDAQQVQGILDSMITRICISLPAAGTGIDEDAAAQLLELFFSMNDSINVLQQEPNTLQWQQTLKIIAPDKNTAPLIAGYSTRLLADRQLLQGETLVQAFFFAMSNATDPAYAAAWLEGFLKGSGSLLLVDQSLWEIVYNWVSQLTDEHFDQVLPLVRRSFSHFTQPERRKLGEKVKTGNKQSGITVTESGFDYERARKGIPVIFQLIGLPEPPKTNPATHE